MLNFVGLRDREIDQLWSVVAAMVLLAEVTFELDEFQKAKPSNDDVINDIAEFLCLKADQVKRFLCYRYEDGQFVCNYYNKSM